MRYASINFAIDFFSKVLQLQDKLSSHSGTRIVVRNGMEYSETGQLISYREKTTQTDFSGEEARKLLIPVDESELQAHTISKLISKRGVEKNIPELVEPFSYEQDTLW